MPPGEYADLIATLLTFDEAWAQPFTRSLRARVLLLALYHEGLRAAQEARSTGTSIIFHEWGTADRFELRFNGREISFGRSLERPEIEIRRVGFPGALVPREAQMERLDVPNDPTEAAELARRQIRAAVTLLLRRV